MKEQFQPVYEELARKLSTTTGLVMAKIESELNDIEGVTIESLPTIKLYPANDKKNPINFVGDRTEEELLKFLREKMT